MDKFRNRSELSPADEYTSASEEGVLIVLHHLPPQFSHPKAGDQCGGLPKPRNEIIAVRPEGAQSLMEILAQAGKIHLLVRPIDAGLVPAIYLQANEDAEHDDQEFEQNREPFLFAEGVCEPADNQGCDSGIQLFTLS